MKLRYLVYYISFFIPFCAQASPGSYAPIEFVKNEGQWEGNFAYKATTGNGDIYLEPNAFNIILGAPGNIEKIQKHKLGPDEERTLYFHRYRMIFEGANKTPEIIGDKAQKHYYNYYLGNDQSKWKTGIHPNLAVDYKNLYNNIDLHVASSNGMLKYDLIVNPGGDISKVAIRYDGAEKLKTKDKKLLVYTSVGTVEELKPYAFQYIDGERKTVECRFKVKDDIVTYYFPDGYDNSQALIIDPTIVFSTFSGSSYDNWGFTATYDQQGNFYAGGIVSNASGGTGFNYTTGAFQTTFGGGDQVSGSRYPCDISIQKFNDVGTSLIYATYLGGSSNEQPHSLIVDANNNLIVCGRTYSANYPVATNAYDGSHNGGGDIVLTKFNSTATALLGSTYVGGSGDDVVNYDAEEFVAGGLKHNYGDDARSEVIIDNQGNVYVAACTKSTNFPVTSNAYQSALAGGSGQDAVVFKMNPNLTSMTWCTYIGGTSDDAAYVLALDNTQTQLYVAGGTMSSNFPSTPGTLWPTFQGGTDGFILRFQNGGSYALQRGTFIGRSGYDQCYGIQVDMQNNVYAMGQTLGGSFPVSTGVFSVPNSSQFIIKLDNDLTNNLVSTVYGSGTSTATNISPVAFLVDTCDNVYISGWGGDIYTSAGQTLPPGVGTTHNMPLSSGPPSTRTPHQGTTDGADFYFIVLSRDFKNLIYSTYFGGSTSTPEHVDGGTSRFDKNGVVYQAICASCGSSTTGFPTTTGVYSPTDKSGNCNLAALKIAFNLGAVNAVAKAEPNTTVCLGDPIKFNTTGSSNATDFEWDFGDGVGTSTGASPVYTYSKAGTFQVMLVAINPDACKTRDTVFLNVIVDSNSIDADFDVVPTDSCKPYRAAFTNNSRYGSNPNSATFTWYFGDATNYTGKNPPDHDYADTGTYEIMLIMKDPNACNSPDTIIKTISFNNSYVAAGFEGPELICEKTGVLFTNSSTNAASYLWKFGDGGTSMLGSPSYTYDTAGTYTIKLFSYNPATCNQVDSIEKTISVAGTPIANFSHAPVIPVTNEPITFTNTSQFADSYIWDFGDGTSSKLETPRPKLFKRTGTYTVCLQALNKAGCSDTICRKVDADVYPLADVPTGFSPNGDGKNDILYVRGAGIDQMNLKIYNRWGEMIFESTDLSIGWDGTYKNKPQPVEAYAYVLNVTFIDGTTFYKKGNVTLLR